MASKDMEIEVKFHLSNPEAVARFLDKNGKSTGRDVAQKDTYYTPAHRDFMAVRYPFEYLRIRETPKGSKLTYKHLHPENEEQMLYCDEFESSIENPEAMKKLLSAIDFKERTIVEKKRSTWEFKGVEIAIDHLADLGYFIELEALGHKEGVKEAKARLYDVLKEVGADVGPQEHRGYPIMSMEGKGYKFSDWK